VKACITSVPGREGRGGWGEGRKGRGKMRGEREGRERVGRGVWEAGLGGEGRGGEAGEGRGRSRAQLEREVAHLAPGVNLTEQKDKSDGSIFKSDCPSPPGPSPGSSVRSSP
jgi:hypothetical protein